MAISGEWSLLERIEGLIADKQKGKHSSLIKGIGDDCAVFSLGNNAYGLISTDISIAGAHFDTRLSSPEDIGYRAMISNISDISAMGGSARYAFIAIGVPGELDDQYIENIYRGLLDGAGIAGAAIAGGDISRASELTISISIYGDISGRDPIYRKGARPGETLYCTGTVGGSRAGLEILLQNLQKTSPWQNQLVRRHNRPPCRHNGLKGLLDIYRPSAMIDISDGLLADLGHICRASGTGALVEIESLPAHEGLREYALHEKTGLTELLLKSGEEYELLFSSPVQKKRKQAGGFDITPIGYITENEIIIREKGNELPLEPEGFDHFKQWGKQ